MATAFWLTQNTYSITKIPSQNTPKRYNMVVQPECLKGWNLILKRKKYIEDSKRRKDKFLEKYKEYT